MAMNWARKWKPFVEGTAGPVEARPVWKRIVFAIALVAATHGLRSALGRWMGDSIPFVFLYPATILATWYGGIWVGFFTILLMALASDYLWLEPKYEFARPFTPEFFSLLLFVAVSLLINWIVEMLRRALLSNQEARKRLNNYSRELEIAVEARTQRLQESVQDLQAFSYSVSHDLRAPLRAMQAYSRILLLNYRDKLDAEGQAYLERIERAAFRLDRLIEDILTYEQVAGVDMKLERVDLSELSRAILQEYPHLKARAQHVHIEEPLCPVKGHRACLSQCLANLLDNALKFMPPGRVADVHVRTERHNGRVRLCVQDNGLGISADKQQKIFKIFERGHMGFEGTGVGLAIVKKAAERMNGNAGVRSTEGEGSLFWIEMEAS